MLTGDGSWSLAELLQAIGKLNKKYTVKIAFI